MMQVILVRHAETEWNVKGRIQGHNDSALTLRGSVKHQPYWRRLQRVITGQNVFTLLRLAGPGKWDSAWRRVFIVH